MLLVATTLLAGCSSAGIPEPPTVLRMVRMRHRPDAINSEDYSKFREITEDIIANKRDVDPSILPQVTLVSKNNFVNEIAAQTRSGFGPDVLITDSETALELYRQKLIDPMPLSEQDRSETPAHLFDLVTAEDGTLVARPVNQFLQLACSNKERLAKPPTTLAEVKSSSADNTFGMALNLNDLFWTAEAFEASMAMESAIENKPISREQKSKMVEWLKWLEAASYQQNIRFYRDQDNLRNALIQGELDWITCWSNSLELLRKSMKDKLLVSPLPKGPSNTLKTTARLEVWSLGRNSSKTQRNKSLTLIDFITKPWAQKTYALMSRNAMPANRQAATIVAEKFAEGTQTSIDYLLRSINPEAAGGQARARIFRNPDQYEIISDALLETVYDVQDPQDASDKILNSLREKSR